MVVSALVYGNRIDSLLPELFHLKKVLIVVRLLLLV
jgi:hypothetical protein